MSRSRTGSRRAGTGIGCLHRPLSVAFFGENLEAFWATIEQEVDGREVIAERTPQLWIDGRTKPCQAHRDTVRPELGQVEVLLHKRQCDIGVSAQGVAEGHEERGACAGDPELRLHYQAAL